MNCDKCRLCDEIATTATRGEYENTYLEFCSFHAGVMAMMLDILKVSNYVKWKPIYKRENS